MYQLEHAGTRLRDGNFLGYDSEFHSSSEKLTAFRELEAVVATRSFFILGRLRQLRLRDRHLFRNRRLANEREHCRPIGEIALHLTGVIPRDTCLTRCSSQVARFCLVDHLPTSKAAKLATY